MVACANPVDPDGSPDPAVSVEPEVRLANAALTSHAAFVEALESGVFSHTLENSALAGDDQERIAFGCGVLGHVLEHHADDAPAMARFFNESIPLLAAALAGAPAAASDTTRQLCNLIHLATNEVRIGGADAALFTSVVPALLGALQRFRDDADIVTSACGALAALEPLLDAATQPVRQRAFALAERVCDEHGADATAVWRALNLLAVLTCGPGRVSDSDVSVLPLAVAALQRHLQSKRVCELAAGVACNIVQALAFADNTPPAVLALTDTDATAALLTAIRVHGEHDKLRCYAAIVLRFIYDFDVTADATAAAGATLTAVLTRAPPAGQLHAIFQAAKDSWECARARADAYA
jgi:hypothetical protein